MGGSLLRPSLPLLLPLGIFVQWRSVAYTFFLKKTPNHTGSQLSVISGTDQRGKNLLQRGLGGFKNYLSSKVKVNWRGGGRGGEEVSNHLKCFLLTFYIFKLSCHLEYNTELNKPYKGVFSKAKIEILYFININLFDKSWLSATPIFLSDWYVVLGKSVWHL